MPIVFNPTTGEFEDFAEDLPLPPKDGVDGKDGRDGERGPKGDKGDRGEKGEDGRDGKDGVDGLDGVNGRNGISLDYEWDGTKLGIKRENEGEFQFVDLKGKDGIGGISGGGGGNAKKVLQQVEAKYAPYTGATTNVDLGAYGLMATNLGMTMQTSTLTGTQTAFPYGLIKWNGSSTLTIAGIIAPSSSTMCIIQNATSSQTIQILHQSSIPALANRIITQTNSTIAVNMGQSAIFYYDTSVSRWRLHNVGFINSASSPLTVSNGQISIPVATSSVNGYLSSTNWNTFNDKVGGSGTVNSLPYWQSSSVLSGAANTYIDNSTTKLGVGTTLPSATIHSKSNVLTGINDLTSVSATLTQFIPLLPPSSYAVTQTTPNLNRTSSAGTSVIAGATNYIAGDVIDYRVYAYNSDGDQTFSVVYTQTQATILNGTGAGDGDYVDISWIDDAAGNETVTGYLILRQVNGGGFNDGQDVGLVTTFSDTESGWTTVGILPAYPDFTANGSTVSFDAYGLNPIGGTDVFSSTPTNYSFSDDNSGDAYLRTHATTPDGTTTARIIADGLTYYDGLNFVEDSTTFQSGSTVTPDTYGTISDGSFWNKTYELYNYDSSLGVYSANSAQPSTTDPSDSNYYYVILTFSSAITYAKIIRDGGSENLTSPAYDNGSGFLGDTVVTPSGIYPSAIIGESHGSSTSDKATAILRSLDGGYVRLEFQDNTNTALSYLEQNSATLKLNSTSINLSATNLGFYGATPVARSTGWSVTAGYTADKAFNPEATSLTEVARVLGVLIDSLKSNGMLGS